MEQESREGKVFIFNRIGTPLSPPCPVCAMKEAYAQAAADWEKLQDEREKEMEKDREEYLFRETIEEDIDAT